MKQFTGTTLGRLLTALAVGVSLPILAFLSFILSWMAGGDGGPRTGATALIGDILGLIALAAMLLFVAGIIYELYWIVSNLLIPIGRGFVSAFFTSQNKLED